MNRLAPVLVPRNVDGGNSARPAVTFVHDSPEVRLILFRLLPGQSVPPHRSSSTVVITVLDGSGVLSGEPDAEPQELDCRMGDVVSYMPNELHGMRAGSETMLLLASITPRPGERADRQ